MIPHEFHLRNVKGFVFWPALVLKRVQHRADVSPHVQSVDGGRRSIVGLFEPDAYRALFLPGASAQNRVWTDVDRTLSEPIRGRADHVRGLHCQLWVVLEELVVCDP